MNKRYTMLRALSVISRLLALLFLVQQAVGWVSFNLPFGQLLMPTPSQFMSTLLISFIFWIAGYIANAAADSAESAQHTERMVKRWIEGQVEGSKPVYDPWQEPVSEGQHWRNKFGRWRPEKRPVDLGDPFEDRAPVRKGIGYAGDPRWKQHVD